jgi:hypothetical protein
MTGTNFSSWYNQTQGTFVTQYQVIAVAPATTTQTLLQISDGTANNAVEFYKRANADVSTRFAVGVGAAANQVFLNAGTFVTTPSKLAGAYQTDNFAASLNAATPVTDTVGNLPTVSQMFIGSNLSGTGFVNGTISRISFYPTRLPNSTLQALTA